MKHLWPPQVFLSHSTSDTELVQLVKTALERAGSCGVYLAEDDPQPGENLPAKLSAAIRASVGFVVLLTEAGADSRLVHQEIGVAHTAGLPVVAVAEPSIATDAEKLGLLTGQEHILVDPANPAQAILDLQRWFQRLPLEVPSKPPPLIPTGPRPTRGLPLGETSGNTATAPFSAPAGSDALVLALILILAGIVLLSVAASS